MHSSDDFPIGNVIFTSAGEALSKITEQHKLEGYEEAVKKYLKSKGVSVEEESSYNVTVFRDGVQVTKKNPV